jgi:sugar-specific transcriptional regulator TrmB
LLTYSLFQGKPEKSETTKKKSNMALTKENVNTFVSAGLTTLQAKVYLGIVQTKKADVKTISKITNIDRSNVYKTLLSLQDQGIVIKLLQTPSQYIASPPQQVISALIKEKKTELLKIQTSSQKIIQKLTSDNEYFPSEEFLLIFPGKEPFYRKWESTVKSVQNNLDIISSERREPKDTSTIEAVVPLLKRGAQVRVIFDRSEHNDGEFTLRIKQLQNLRKYRNWKGKFSFRSQRPFMAIKDRNLAVICLDQCKLFKNSRTLWTNNPNIVSTSQNRFDTLWEAAQEIQKVKKYSGDYR